MTSHAVTAPATRTRSAAVRAAVRIAGITYLVAWVTGLSVWPTNPSVAATGPEVLAGLAGHTGVAITQYVATQGIAGLALAAVVAGRLRRPARFTGYAAVAVSLVQCALGVHLAAYLAPAHQVAAAHTAFALLNRLDGVKMLLLAATALLASGPAVRSRSADWIDWTGLALAVAITVSGVGYLLLSTALAPAAYVSGVLLLLWVTATAVTSRRV
ncbi:hypothetical protein [Kitasatospora acidiphila]|uniref:hypothetical protein n=1 Tax=Kitasatospora acidiphila TaxID=2567942 RepID=UPI003C7880EF